ncbi:glycosyltransferase [Frigoribacterium sp. 2-23]|uniref:glycosyltransferase n=1 Tax=Frigoribacterium sp. 2-23 TaxID=3415006 RepID=UPI003C701CF3
MTTTNRPDIVHVSSAHPWTDNRVHLREAATLADAGYRVRLIAVANDLETEATRVDVVTIPRRSRLTRMVVGSAHAIALAVRSRARVVHLHDPELVWAIPALRALGRSVIFDAHEDLPDQVASKAYIPRPLRPMAVLAARLVVRLGSTADRVVAATATIADTYPDHKTVTVRNYPRLRVEEASASPLSERPKRLVFVGALTQNRGSRVLPEVTRSAEFPTDWRLHVAGTVPAAELAVLTATTTPAHAAVAYHGIVSPAVARDLLLESRIGLVAFQPTDAHLNSLPTKLFEYMAAGLAIIVSDFPLWRELLSGHDNVTFVDPLDPHAIADAVARYDRDSELLDRHGRNGRRAALEVFNWCTEEKTLLGLYADLLDTARARR